MTEFSKSLSCLRSNAGSSRPSCEPRSQGSPEDAISSVTQLLNRLYAASVTLGAFVSARHKLLSVLHVASDKRIFRARSCSLHLFLVCVVLVAPTLAAGGEVSGDVAHIIPPGQEESLGKMLGRGAPLPGDCRFAGGTAAGATVTAEYACGDAKVVLELRHPDDAPPTTLRTARFAIAVRSGSVPPGLLEALATLIRAHEAELEWKQVPGSRLRPPQVLVAGACSLMLFGLAFQYLVSRRLARPRDVFTNPVLGVGSMCGKFRARRMQRELADAVCERARTAAARLAAVDAAIKKRAHLLAHRRTGTRRHDSRAFRTSEPVMGDT